MINTTMENLRRMFLTLKIVANLFIEKFILFDKVQLILFMTWVWALSGLYLTKLFELIFRAVLRLPDSWLGIFNNLDIVNDTGKHIHILHATNGVSPITNKLKLFLKYYWTYDQDDGGRFSFQSLSKQLNCSVLYCSYLLTYPDRDISPSVFWNDIHKFSVYSHNGKIYQCTTDKQEKLLLFNEVRFNGKSEEIVQCNNNLQESLRNEILCALNVTST